MQGLVDFIPTSMKIDYLNQLLRVGFDTIDCGSFVSPKAIPQMRDTSEVIKHLEWRDSTSKLLVIVVNVRGAHDACAHDAVHYVGYPMSISETFQKRNTNRSITDALNDLEQIIELVHQSNKKIVTYISMGFGNPYGDPYDENIVSEFAGLLMSIGSDIVSLADTIGNSTESQIKSLVTLVSKRLPGKEIGVHLHSNTLEARSKIKAAFEAGCRRMDGALNGYGGCPMAKDELVGNVATEEIVAFMDEQGVKTGIREDELRKAVSLASKIFPIR